jgi:MFS family permease
MKSKLLNPNLFILILCQGLFLTNNVTFIAVNGLVGLSLAPMPWMATLPVMGYVIGGALSTPLVSMAQAKLGRKRCFQLGLVVALLSALICAYAAWSQSFELLITGTLIAGFYSANGQLYRFAAAEVAPKEFREKAVSWVLAGGLIGAVIGPNLASWTEKLFETPFLGAYLALSMVGLLGLGLMSQIHFEAEAKASSDTQSARPTLEIITQPVFIICVICAALGYGIMNLLMAATPLAMRICSLPFSSTALVLEWHVIGMFAPGFFTGSLIVRFGKFKVMMMGVLLNMLCVIIALSGSDVAHFLAALLCLGVGWNFLFTGATTLAMSTYTAQEKNTAQGAINFCVFATMAVTSFGSGALITTQGWSLLNVSSLAFVMVIFVTLIVWRIKYADKS